MSNWLPADLDTVAETLARTEARLDPARPEDGHVHVLGYGEISASLTTDELPGLVCKRMAGFPDHASVAAYVALVREYLAELAAAGICAAPTETIPVSRRGRPPIVYLVQPRYPAGSLGNALLRTTDDAGLESLLRDVLRPVTRLAQRSAGRTDGVEVALDGQLSNWSVPDTPTGGIGVGDSDPGPILIDVGTPFIRRDGRHRLDVDIVLAPAPPGIRALLRRFVADAYQDDYFVPRTLAVDLLGNFHKERAAARIPAAIYVVNDWLASTDLPGPRTPIRVDEVDAYYRTDARLLSLFLHARRADRALRTKVLRQPYDFLLPGRVAR